ncbi:MAG TPA: efflux RND transporter periplasmic adaptor subunit [Lysobacter sp.]|nr:efflux RND transporter periplasmic adaptor subunit [Lysobacter sp.]
MSQSTLVRSAVAALGCAAVAMLSACGESHSQEEAGNAAPEVSVVTLKKQPVTLTRELPGRARAFLVAEVRPQVGGIVRRRMFTEGGFVKAGQSLYELDDASYRAQYESAQASLRKAQATLHAAQLAAKRSRELIRVSAISAQDNESAIAAEAQARADVGVAQAAVDSSRVDLARAHIVAPISGRIGKSNVTAGALVTANQAEALALIQQLDPMYVEVNQPSNNWLTLKQAIDAGRVRSDDNGATVKILLENGTAYGHEGKLQFADVTVDPATGNVLLRAIVPNPNALLLPGMYVRTMVTEGISPDAVLAPQQGITRDPKGNANALVVGKDGKVGQRAVQVSRTVGDQWLVEDGLAAGDRVIVEGVQKVEPGTVVQAVEYTAARAGASP